MIGDVEIAGMNEVTLPTYGPMHFYIIYCQKQSDSSPLFQMRTGGLINEILF